MLHKFLDEVSTCATLGDTNVILGKSYKVLEYGLRMSLDVIYILRHLMSKVTCIRGIRKSSTCNNRKARET